MRCIMWSTWAEQADTLSLSSVQCHHSGLFSFPIFSVGFSSPPNFVYERSNPVLVAKIHVMWLLLFNIILYYCELNSVATVLKTCIKIEMEILHHISIHYVSWAILTLSTDRLSISPSSAVSFNTTINNADKTINNAANHCYRGSKYLYWFRF